MVRSWQDQCRTQRGGGAAGAVAPQRKLNLQFLFYFKYIGQDKSCLIFKYIGALSSFAPLAKKSCVRPWAISCRILQRSCNNLHDFLKDHGKILTKSRQDLAEFLKDHGKIIARSWEDLGKILQELAGFRQDHGKIMARS